MWLHAVWHFLRFLQRERSITITNFLPSIPFLSSLLETTGRSGTGRRKALSISMISPSTESNFTFSPVRPALSSVVKGFFLSPQPANAPAASKPVSRNSRLEFFSQPPLQLQLMDLRFTVV